MHDRLILKATVDGFPYEVGKPHQFYDREAEDFIFTTCESVELMTLGEAVENCGAQDPTTPVYVSEWNPCRPPSRTVNSNTVTKPGSES